MLEEIDIRNYFRVLKKYWRIWVVIFLVAEFITLILSVRQEKVYEATATILAPEIISEGKFSGISSILGEGFPSGLLGGGAASQAVIAMLKSRRMAEYVARDFNLMAVYKTKNNITAAERIRAMTKISLSKDNTIMVKVGAPNPILAANIANFYATNLDSLNEELKVSSVKPITTLLDSALPSPKPVKPRVKLNLLISGVFSLFIGILLSFIIEYFNNPLNQKKINTVKP